MKDIKELREEINKIDSDMAELFTRRMDIVNQIALYKKERGLAIYDENREKEIIRNNLSLIKDEKIKEYYLSFFKSVLKESKRYQEYLTSGLKVGYSGIPGAFSHIASMKMYPHATYVSYPDFESAYKACQEGEIDIVILPIENSFAGEVGAVMDLIFQGDLFINQMLDLEITQNLLGVKGSSLNTIKKVISHPQALSQSKDFLLKHNFELIEAANTSLAAKEVKEKNDPSIAAVGSEEVAELFGLEVISRNINSKNNNTTRFASLSRIERIPSAETKMGEHFLLMYTVKNQAGALAQSLNIIGAHSFNMRTLRSRPMKDLMWNYYFFVEIEGNINSRDGRDVLVELKTVCDRLKVVGTYYDFKEK